MATILQLRDLTARLQDLVEDWLFDGQPDCEMLVITDHGNDVISAELRIIPFDIDPNEREVDVATLIYDGEPDYEAIQTLAEEFLFIGA